MLTDILSNADLKVMRAPAALTAATINSSYVDLGDQVRPAQVLLAVGALGGETCTVSKVTVADDSSGTGATDLTLADVRVGNIGALGDGDLEIDVDNEVLVLQFTATKRYCRVTVVSTGTGPAAIYSIGAKTGR